MLILKFLSVTSLLGVIITDFVSMVVDVRPSVEDSLPHVKMCDGIDVILNQEYSFSLKVVAVAIFIGVVNTRFFSNAANTRCGP